MPRFADPWAFRPARRTPDLVAGHDGRPAAVALFTQGNVVTFRMTSPVVADGPQEQSRLPALLRRVSAIVARYRNEAWCTDVQLRTIEALWVEGVSLRAFARREHVAPAAIEARVNGLHTKAPEFYRWWRRKHESRRRR